VALEAWQSQALGAIGEIADDQTFALQLDQRFVDRADREDVRIGATMLLSLNGSPGNRPSMSAWGIAGRTGLPRQATLG